MSVKGQKVPGKASPAVYLAAIFIINFLSLVFQIIWVRKIMVIFGTTALSISTILTVFLSGIALGGYLGSKWTRNRSAFCGYSLMALGVYCFASIYLFGLIKYPFHYFIAVTEAPALINIFKLILCFVILIFPTTIIGMMFPLITYLYSSEFKKLGRDVASIYFLDTLGAAGGAALCGFFLVPVVGLKASALASALIYIALGALILKMGRTDDMPHDHGKTADSANKGIKFDGTRVFVLFGLFFSGFAALILEVTWSRYFHLLFGTSIYAFSLVVAAFLLGLSAGSFLIRKVLDRLKNPLLVFAYLEILIAGFSFLILRTSGLVEIFYFKLFNSISNFYIFQSFLFGAAFLVMLVPTSLMGANFPLAIRIFGRSSVTRGEDAGLTFSVNTAGGIVGAFAAGFFVIPMLGLEKTSLMASLIYLVIGVVFLFLSARKPLQWAGAASIAVPFLIWGYSSHNEPDLNYSIYYHGVQQHGSIEDFKSFRSRVNTLYSKQGYYGLVAVNQDPVSQKIFLLNNGKSDASTDPGDMQMQLMLGHLPFFLHKAPDRVLNIGLGGGFTLGAVVTHPEVKYIDMVEIDPLVVEATDRYFSKYNNNALADPRVRVRIQDGRHYLETANDKYDVIISEPPNIWVSGVSQLFTREFYRIVDEHLNSGGTLATWVPLYEMYDEDLKLIMRTIKERFEYVAFWTNGMDVLIWASHVMPVVDPEYVYKEMGVESVAVDLRRAVPEISGNTMINILSNPKVAPQAMDSFVKGDDSVNTDNLPILEFRTARNIFNIAHAK